MFSDRRKIDQKTSRAINRRLILNLIRRNGAMSRTDLSMMTGLSPATVGFVVGSLIDEGFLVSREAQGKGNGRRPVPVALNVDGNLAIGVQTRLGRIECILADFEINIDLNAYPYQLSGGQQQTVSILRALVTNPEVLFLDEPFSALDYEMTLFMREQIQKIYMKTGTTTLLVSHDLEEAIQLADKVMLLTRRPTRVAEIVDIDLPWPRTTSLTTDPRFVDLKRYCLDVFWQEVSRTPPQSPHASRLALDANRTRCARVRARNIGDNP